MKPLQVLLIEDQALIALLLEDMLAEMGHKVCAVAATEGEAVAAADRHHPDLMIVDMELRGGSGSVAVDKIQLNRPVPHFFTSGDPVGVKLRRPNAVVLAKPYRQAMLARAIETAISAADAL